MARVFKKLVYPGLFHHLSGIDDGHPVGMTGEYAKIMRDEDQSQAELVLKIAQDGHDLRLNRHIESGGRLVCDQKIGIVGDGHRNHDTLAHAAGKLMRILFDPLVGCGIETSSSNSTARASACLRLRPFWWSCNASMI